MRRSFRTRVSFSGWIPRVCTLGWYAMPIQGMGFETGLGHGIGNGSTLRQNGIEADKNSFGETFGAATGVSDPRLQSGKEKETSALLLFSQARSIQTQRRNCWPVSMDDKMVEARGVEPLS